MVEALQVLTVEEIIEINRDLTIEFGGTYQSATHNLLNPGSLHYIVNAVQEPIYEVDLYPTQFEKAAAVAWNIITRHIFVDGNKRTAMEACRQILELSNLAMRIDDDVVDVALQIAKLNIPEEGDQITFEGFVEWLKLRCTPICSA